MRSVNCTHEKNIYIFINFSSYDSCLCFDINKFCFVCKIQLTGVIDPPSSGAHYCLSQYTLCMCVCVCECVLPFVCLTNTRTIIKYISNIPNIYNILLWWLLDNFQLDFVCVCVCMYFNSIFICSHYFTKNAFVTTTGFHYSLQCVFFSSSINIVLSYWLHTTKTCGTVYLPLWWSLCGVEKMNSKNILF